MPNNVAAWRATVNGWPLSQAETDALLKGTANIYNDEGEMSELPYDPDFAAGESEQRRAYAHLKAQCEYQQREIERYRETLTEIANLDSSTVSGWVKDVLKGKQVRGIAKVALDHVAGRQ